MTTKMLTQVSELIEQVLLWQDAVRWIPHSWVTTKLQMHIIVSIISHWLLLVPLLHYDGHHCGALPVKRAPSRLIPFPPDG